MPVIYDETSALEDTRPCARIRVELKKCLLDSDCVKMHKKTPRECLMTQDNSVPTECYQLKKTFFECKRSVLDPRCRFRGRKGYTNIHSE